MSDLSPVGDEPTGDVLEVDPAAASAASDPAPGARRRGRPPGAKNRVKKSTLSDAQLAQRRAAAAKGAGARAASPTRTGPTDAQLREAIAQVYAMTGFGLGWVDAEVGQTLAECSQGAAEAWVRLGQQNPAVRRVLVQVTTAGATSELFMAHAPLVALTVARLTSRQMVVHPTNPMAEPPPAATNGFAAAPPYTATN